MYQVKQRDINRHIYVEGRDGPVYVGILQAGDMIINVGIYKLQSQGGEQTVVVQPVPAI